MQGCGVGKIGCTCCLGGVGLGWVGYTYPLFRSRPPMVPLLQRVTFEKRESNQSALAPTLGTSLRLGVPVIHVEFRPACLTGRLRSRSQARSRADQEKVDICLMNGDPNCVSWLACDAGNSAGRRVTHGFKPSFGHTEPRRGAECRGKAFLVTFCALQKVTRCKSGTVGGRDLNNGYVYKKQRFTPATESPATPAPTYKKNWSKSP